MGYNRLNLLFIFRFVESVLFDHLKLHNCTMFYCRLCRNIPAICKEKQWKWLSLEWHTEHLQADERRKNRKISDKSIFALIIDYYYLCNRSCLIREYWCKQREGSVSKSLPLILLNSDYQIYILNKHFGHQKAVPKVSAGHLRRDRTAVLTERAQKTALFCTPAPGARTAVRSDSSSGAMRKCCALRATMIISSLEFHSSFS